MRLRCAKFAFLEERDALSGKSSVRGRRISIILQLRGLEEVQAARGDCAILANVAWAGPLEIAILQGSCLAQRDLVAGRTVGAVFSAVFSAVLHMDIRSIELFGGFGRRNDRRVFKLENCFLDLGV